MIPNEGGNQFSGNFFGGGTPGVWQAENINQRVRDLGVNEVPKADIIYDFNTAIGGPMVRDTLWFFATARRNVVNAGVLNSTNRDGTPALDRNSITNGNARLTWQMTSQHKISAMFDKVRKRRFSQHAFGEDLETAASTWNSPHYDVGTAKWTGTLSNRMLAEFGFSLHFGDWDPGYYQYSSLGASDPGHRVERQGDEGTRHGSGGLGRGGRTSRAEGEGTHVGRARRRRRARFDG